MSEQRTDAYGCNMRDELVSASKLGGSASVPTVTEYSYQYDDIGNRITSLDLGTNRVYSANELNQYSSITTLTSDAGLQTSGFEPQFDLDGNQTLIQTSTGVWQVQYNAENRPVLWTCLQPNNQTITTNQTISMLFDRMGRRVEYVETTGGPGSVPATTNVHHRFVYDGYLCIQRLDATANNLVELSFAWDPTEPVATRPLVMQRNGGWNFFYTHDGNKNVSDVVSFQQARGVPAHYEYAPFGAVTAVVTNTAITAFNVSTTNPFRFSSEYADDTLGLVYYNYRHYDPVAGRWVRRDVVNDRTDGHTHIDKRIPAAYSRYSRRANGCWIKRKSVDEINSITLYLFVNNSPMLRNDRIGLSPVGWQWSWWRMPNSGEESVIKAKVADIVRIGNEHIRVLKDALGFNVDMLYAPGEDPLVLYKIPDPGLKLGQLNFSFGLDASKWPHPKADYMGVILQNLERMVDGISEFRQWRVSTFDIGVVDGLYNKLTGHIGLNCALFAQGREFELRGIIAHEYRHHISFVLDFGVSDANNPANYGTLFESDP